MNKYIKVLLDNLPDMTFSTDLKGQFANINKVMLKKLGYTSQELSKMKVEDLVPEEDSLNIKKHYILVSSVISHIQETRFSTKAGEFIDVELTSNFLGTNGKSKNSGEGQSGNGKSHVMNVAKDNTMKKELEDKIHTMEIKLEQSNATDSLTGLYNHTFLKSDIDIEIKRAIRYKHPFAIAMIGVDKFKFFEHVYGREECYPVLKKLGIIIKNVIRYNVDKAYRPRIGVIVMIFPQTSVTQVVEISERIRKQFFDIEFNPKKYDGQKNPTHISLSIGVTAYNKTDNHKTLLDRALLAMYNSKKLGRDNVYVLENESDSIASDNTDDSEVVEIKTEVVSQ